MPKYKIERNFFPQEDERPVELLTRALNAFDRDHTQVGIPFSDRDWFETHELGHISRYTNNIQLEKIETSMSFKKEPNGETTITRRSVTLFRTGATSAQSAYAALGPGFTEMSDGDWENLFDAGLDIAARY